MGEPPPEPYAYAIRAGDTLYLAGQVSFDADGNVVGDTAADQARRQGSQHRLTAPITGIMRYLDLVGDS